MHLLFSVVLTVQGLQSMRTLLNSQQPSTVVVLIYNWYVSMLESLSLNSSIELTLEEIMEGYVSY